MIIRIEQSGFATGPVNMDTDRRMMELVRRREVAVAVRTYSWAPWCVSLGRNQEDSAISSAACLERGFDVVRRPTGGRAVLHANELTYCIVTRTKALLTPRKIYTATHELIFEALSALVGGLSFSGVPTDLRNHYASSGPLGQSCFSSHARSEIMYGNRKVVGSAQRVVNDIVLQHGSILCGPGHEGLADVIVANQEQRLQLRTDIEASSATLSSIAGRVLPIHEVENVIHASFSNGIEAKFAH